MRGNLVRALLAIATTGLSTFVVAPAAHASMTDEIQGGCMFNTDSPQAVTGTDVYSGVIGDFSVTDDGGVVPLPVDATVTCWVDVDYTVAPGTTFTYGDGTTAIQAGANPITYTAGLSDIVQLCQQVHYADGTISYDCGCACDPQLPPQRVIDTLNAVFAVYNELFVDYIDPAICPSLASIAGTYGPVVIHPDGDVYVTPDPTDVIFTPGLLSPLEDCPPYGS